MKCLWRPSFHCISWWYPDSRIDQERGKMPNRRSKDTAFPAKNKLCNSGTRHCIIFTLHVCMTVDIFPSMLRCHNNSPTVHNKQDRMTTTEQLCCTAQTHCGVFWAPWLAVTDDHHKLFINLTSQQWGGRSCEATSLCPQVWALRERTTGWSWYHMCEKDEYEWEGVHEKHDCLTEICWRAGLVGFWEFHYHLMDTERKSRRSIMA